MVKLYPIEWAMIIIASLGILFGIGVLLYALIASFKENCKKIIYSKASWLTALTILSCLLASSYKNFFYGFPAVPILIAALTVILISRRLMMASVIRNKRWISVILAIFWGIWSFCIYALLQFQIMPDYVTLYQLKRYDHVSYGVMLATFAVLVMIISTPINLQIAIEATEKQKKEKF